MELNPDYIKENLSKIGIKEASALLKEWIISSNDLNLRKDALELFGSLDDGKNFKFLEQVFLSDEDLEIRLIAGKILEDMYINHKKLIPLLEYSLRKIKELEQTINNTDVDLVISGTPIDITRVLTSSKPIVRIKYGVGDETGKELVIVADEFIKKYLS